MNVEIFAQKIRDVLPPRSNCSRELMPKYMRRYEQQIDEAWAALGALIAMAEDYGEDHTTPAEPAA